MSLKEKMMNGMMDKMSAEERKEMMDGMMETFFSKMSVEEKQVMMNEMMGKFFSGISEGEKNGMMQNMMPKMMEQMMGGNNSPMGGGMMNMMSMMMGRKTEDGKEGEKPWDMCGKMMSSITKTADLAVSATPEVKQLFEDWIQQIDEEILDFVKKEESIDIDKTAEKFKLSKESVVYFLTRLAQKGKINFKK
jgi:hypothetical protein